LPERILVTGGAGFIGSHLVDALVTQGHRVRVFDNLEPQVHGGLREQGKWPDTCNPDAETILGDVRDREALRQAMQGVYVIFHEAAAVGVGQSMYEIERYVDANTRGTAVLLDILANDATTCPEPGRRVQSRVRKLIVASSMSIYGEGKYECPVHGVVYPRLRPNDQLAARDWEMRCPVRSPKSEVQNPKSRTRLRTVDLGLRTQDLLLATYRSSPCPRMKTNRCIRPASTPSPRKIRGRCAWRWDGRMGFRR